MDKLQSILEDLEKEAQAKKVILTNTFNNQPELISISSDSAIISTQNSTNDAYYSFTVNLVRPALGVKTVQLLKANIPQATALSFTNGELLFPYYRIRTQENIANYDYFTEKPNYDNLYYVRLLPSYYPSNIIPNAQLYGFNKTFNNYQELSDELAKACANDLRYTNGFSDNHFIPNDCLISYNSEFNKFEFKGNNTTLSWSPDNFVLNPATTYQINKIVSYNGVNYISTQNNNSVNAALIIYNWTSSIPFKKYNIAYYDSGYYTAILDSTNVLPDLNIIYWLPSAYDPSINYGGSKIGFNCRYNNLWYVSIFSGANTGNQPDISPTYWRLQPYNAIAKVVLKIYDWSSLGYYVANNVVLYQGVYYRAIGAQEFIPPTGDPLSSTYWTTINYDDIPLIYIPSRWRTGLVSQPFNTVYSATNTLYYTCVAENTGIDPTDPVNGPNYWVLSQWSSLIHYSTRSPQGGPKDFPVYYNDKWYSSTALTPNDNEVPTDNPAYWNSGSLLMDWWQLYTGTFGYSYLIAGYDDPNVLILQKYINQEILAANPDFFYGRYGLNNIVSIPTPPVTVGKTLAKRLGFTWNGTYNWPLTNDVTPFQYAQGSSVTIFWNRFRPIPNYEIIEDDLGSIPIPNNNPFTSTTYIAENFCNLVYTSILSIISNITTASSLDSTARRNLLWLLPMNCGQLGISFSDAFIDTPLTKINNDIYQINIELRNELDEPFYISNNGISTFLLKLTY